MQMLVVDLGVVGLAIEGNTLDTCPQTKHIPYPKKYRMQPCLGEKRHGICLLQRVQFHYTQLKP